jgi:VWFA-related protein
MLRYALPLLLLVSAAMAQAQSTAQDTPVTTLRTQVRITTVDVVVTDGKGNPVQGLKPEDFTVTESKAPQKITSFDEHKGGAAGVYEKPPAGTFTNATAVRGGVSNVLLVDWLNTPVADQAYMRDQLVKFVLSQPGGTRTAIFALSSTVHLLQDFTADPAVLKLAIVKLGTKFSPLVRDYNFAADPSVQILSDRLQAMTGGPGGGSLSEDLASKIQTMNDMYTREQSVQTRNAALITMQGLASVARYLDGVSGRKNVFWVSGGFPSFIQRDPQSTSGHPFEGNEDMTLELQHTINTLASAQIALYPVDPRGVPIPPSMTGQLENQTTNLSAQRAINGSSSFTPQDDNYYNSQFREHTTMEEIAGGTGGKAFFNTNDINGALRQAQSTGDFFYTLTYTPPPFNKPKQYRDIVVKVRGKGLHLAYRRGYYTPDHLDGKVTAANTLRTADAMRPESPQSSEVLFQVKPVPGTDAGPAKIIGARAAGDGAQVYRLNFNVDLSTLHFEPAADGKMHGIFDFSTVIYDRNGKQVDSRVDRADLALDDARYRAMQQGGLHFHTFIALPRTGSGDSVRIAVHDASNDRIGTVLVRATELREAMATN